MPEPGVEVVAGDVVWESSRSAGVVLVVVGEVRGCGHEVAVSTRVMLSP